MARKPAAPKQVEALAHDEVRRRLVPTAEQQSLAQRAEAAKPFEPQAYPRATALPHGAFHPRDTDLDPQITWNGAEIVLTDAQIESLKAGDKIVLGEAQLTWRGKDQADWSDLVVETPPIYVQEHVEPKYLIDQLRYDTAVRREEAAAEPDLFGGAATELEPEARTEFYSHDVDWKNRMILGDSLQAMASLSAREGMAGQVQCIYFDPPYGIKFQSNWQVSTRSRDVKDGKREEITREPEQVRAFRDTWKDGIHSYLTYLRDRLTVMRDMLTESGSIFVQIGDENVHRVRTVMDEVFGEENCAAQIYFLKTTGKGSKFADKSGDYILWYVKNADASKVRPAFKFRAASTLAEQYNMAATDKVRDRRLVKQELDAPTLIPKCDVRFMPSSIYSDSGGQTTSYQYDFHGRGFSALRGYFWRTTTSGLDRLAKAERLTIVGNYIRYRMYGDDYPIVRITNYWDDVRAGGFGESKVYVVQTTLDVVQRCILMTTDPGDLVLDPTCGSGTTATVAEQWGRRWITMDTSRVALALARARLMGARYPYYLLRDTSEGQAKEAALTGAAPPDAHSRPTRGDLREGFVYERAPHVTLKSIANNAEIDTIWEEAQTRLEPLRDALNVRLGRTGNRASPAEAGTDGPWEEWEIPRHPGDPWPEDAAKAHAILTDPAKSKPARTKAMATLRKALADWDAACADTNLLTVRNGLPARDLDDLPEHPLDPWDDAEAERLHTEWWAERIARQTAIDGSIAQKADVELLYDRPIPDTSRVRVAGPFTVESLSPHRMVPADEDDGLSHASAPGAPVGDFAAMILEQLRAAGVQQSAKEDRITFDGLDPWPGEWLGAQGAYTVLRADGTPEARRAGILIGPEFGTLTRTDLTAAAREAVDAGFDLLIACGFAFDAHSSELAKLGPLPILKARMNPDLHMSADLKATGAGNLFVVFGEPDVTWTRDAEGRIAVTVHEVDVFDPKTTEVRASGKDEIAAWFIDTDYDEEAFHVRHAYFTGANDPYKALKTTLRDEIDRDAWETLNRLTSRPFAPPETGRFAVKVINHLGDEVMKVFTVNDDG